MTLDEIIAARVTKYTMDILRHNTPANPDGACRCEGCHLSRKMLSELGYIQMAARNLTSYSSCPKCHRTRNDFDCAEGACPMVALPAEMGSKS